MLLFRRTTSLSLEEILPEFDARVRRIVWSHMATVDSAGRPRMRVVHIVWDGTSGYLTTAPGSPKLAHVAHNDMVSVGYWDAVQTTVTLDCRAIVLEDQATKAAAFQLIKSEPEPYGVDSSLWGGTPENPGFALIRLGPWRIELAGYPTLWNWESKVWRKQPAHESRP